MAISIDWATKIITVQKADMTLIDVGPPEVYELDVDAFRLQLKGLEASEEGMTFLDTHRHFTEVTLGGVAYARIVEIINGYTVTFEAGSYVVNLAGANNNVLDVLNLNGVQLRSANSGGLVSLRELSDSLGIAVKIAQNKSILDPVLGKLTIYDDDGVTPWLVANVYESTDTSQPYRGQGVQRQERLE